MNENNTAFDRLSNLIAKHAQQEGVNISNLPNILSFKQSQSSEITPLIDQPAIWIIANGEKSIYLGDKQYNFKRGDLVILLLPMALECAFKNASPDDPFLMASIIINTHQIAEVSQKLDQIREDVYNPTLCDPSALFSIPLTEEILNPMIRLFSVMANPVDAQFLGNSIIDEIFFRILCTDRGGQMRYLLQSRGEVQRISKAVQHIHKNIDQPVSVEDLADMVHMSQTTFYENFKNVLQLSPLQYAKSVKLNRANALIREGKKANEAAYLVGYNSSAQFSREYKRHYGYSPSQTPA